jgi:hypothetical protein
MKPRAKRLVLKAQVEHRHEADTYLTQPGAAVLIFRGIARSVAIACPDGCGEVLTINLDRRAGPAWRCYAAGEDVTLYPSVWRTTGCESHFIVWRSKIYWCDRDEELDCAQDSVVERTLSALSNTADTYLNIADGLGIEPWAVLSACNLLVRSGLAEASKQGSQTLYRRKTRP